MSEMQPSTESPAALAGDRAAQGVPVWAIVTRLTCIVAIWIATRPYWGVIHDARLYSIQALNVLHPGRFAHDFYFQYGSQDSFSAFTAIYRVVIGALGVATANLAAALVGEALWLVSAAWLTRVLFQGRREWLFALLAIVALDPKYGGLGIFTYGEPFATPRLYAEALVMAALAMAARRQWAGFAVAIAAAAALHPLMAAGGAGVAVLLAAFHERRIWFALGLGGAALAVLIWLGPGPLARARVAMDPAWLAIVERRSGVFVSLWQWDDYLRMAATFCGLGAGFLVAGPREKRMLLALTVVTFAGLLASFLGADLGHNFLAIDLQLWRVLWLASLAANVCMAMAILRIPTAWTSRGLFIGAAAANAAGYIVLAGSVVGSAMTVLALLALVAETYWRRPLPAAARIPAIALFIVGGLGIVGIVAVACIRLGYDSRYLIRLGSAGVAIGALGVFFLVRRERLLLVAAGALVVTSGALANLDSPWDRYAVAAGRDGGIHAFMAGAGKTYWEGDPGLQAVWFKLGMPSYYSCLQGTGAMFNRQTAMEYDRRGEVLRGLNTLDFSDDSRSICMAKAVPYQIGPTNRSQLVEVCRKLPDLDTIVLHAPVPGVAARTWRAPVTFEFMRRHWQRTIVSTFYRFSCAPLR